VHKIVRNSIDSASDMEAKLFEAEDNLSKTYNELIKIEITNMWLMDFVRNLAAQDHDEAKRFLELFSKRINLTKEISLENNHKDGKSI
jgi:cytidylate kinase